MTVSRERATAESPPARRRRGASRLASRALLALLILAAPLWAGNGVPGASRIDRGVQAVTRDHAFSLVRWEIDALASSALRAIRPAWSPGLDPAADRQMVVRYAELTGQLASLGRERDRVEATEAEPLLSQHRDELARRAEAVAAERQALAEPVEAIVAWQIEQVLAQQGIRRGLLEVATRPAFPFLSAEVTPGVAFRLGQMPDLLVVAPRDRIAVLDSVLLDPGLTYEQVDRLEASADGLGVSSLVTPIGGLATYPSMVPAIGSVRGTLRTISHEWTHHYLALRPLGRGYFASYELRSINETVADVVGDELGRLVYARYYAGPGETAELTPSPSPDGGQPAQPSFGDLMRGIRAEVEVHLARGDVAGAEAYMAEQQASLARRGYYVRRLNTAYLSFFGAYSGGANPYEPKLRALRQRSGSLSRFLEQVSGITSDADLDRLATS